MIEYKKKMFSLTGSWRWSFHVADEAVGKYFIISCLHFVGSAESHMTNQLFACQYWGYAKPTECLNHSFANIQILCSQHVQEKGETMHLWLLHSGGSLWAAMLLYLLPENNWFGEAGLLTLDVLSMLFQSNSLTCPLFCKLTLKRFPGRSVWSENIMEQKNVNLQLITLAHNNPHVAVKWSFVPS